MSSNNLYSLGLQDHDRLNNELGGGIPRGSIVLMEGDYGAGKSAMSQRFSYGLCETNHSVTLLSTELTVRGFIDQMHSLSYGVEEHLLNERLLFLHADVDSGTRQITAPSDSGDNGQRKQLLNRLMQAEAMWDADVVIIDTFDAILRNDPTFEALVRQNEERQAALEIISFFRDLVTQGNRGTEVVERDDPPVVAHHLAPALRHAGLHADPCLTHGRDHAVAVGLVLSVEPLAARHRHHPRRIPLAASAVRASTRELHLQAWRR